MNLQAITEIILIMTVILTVLGIICIICMMTNKEEKKKKFFMNFAAYFIGVAAAIFMAIYITHFIREYNLLKKEEEGWYWAKLSSGKTVEARDCETKGGRGYCYVSESKLMEDGNESIMVQTEVKDYWSK